MEINKVTQIEVEEYLKNKHKKILICASGYESRSIYFSTHYSHLFDIKIAFGINSFKEEIGRNINDSFFISNKFRVIDELEGDAKKIRIEILNIIKENDGVIEFFIDYSSMPRTWYAEIIRLISEIKNEYQINFIFIYSISEYVSPNNIDSFNLHVEPLKGFTYLDSPDKPTALIIGLGYETNRPLGLKEYFDANKVVLFITDKNSSGEYYNDVISKNSELIQIVSKKNSNDIFEYPVFDQEYTCFELEQLCQTLSKNFRVIIAPCGPKFFTLCSLIVSKKNPEIDVWRISQGEQRIPVNREATGEISGLKLELI